MGEKRGRREWQQWQKRGPRAYKREAEAGGVRLHLGLCTSGPCRRGKMRPCRGWAGTITHQSVVTGRSLAFKRGVLRPSVRRVNYTCVFTGVPYRKRALLFTPRARALA